MLSSSRTYMPPSRVFIFIRRCCHRRRYCGVSALYTVCTGFPSLSFKLFPNSEVRFKWVSTPVGLYVLPVISEETFGNIRGVFPSLWCLFRHRYPLLFLQLSCLSSVPSVSLPHRLRVLFLYVLLLFQRVHLSPRFRESPLSCQRRVLLSPCLRGALARAPVRTNPVHSGIIRLSCGLCV